MNNFNTPQNPDKPDESQDNSNKPQGHQTSEGEMTAGALIESIYKNKFHTLIANLLNQLNNVIDEEGKSGETHVQLYRDGLTSLIVNRAPENTIVGPDEAETFWKQHDQIANSLLSSDSELTKQALNLIKKAKEETAEISKKTKQQIEALGVPTGQPTQAIPAQETSGETAISTSKKVETEPMVPFSEEEKERVKNATKGLEFRLRNESGSKTETQLINEHSLRLTQKLRNEFHNGEPKRELEEVKALVAHYLEKIYKLRAKHPTFRTIEPKNKEVKNKVEFSEEELKYIRKSWNNFCQHNKKKKGDKLSKTKHIKRMVKFLNENFHYGEEVRTVQEISKILNERRKTPRKVETAKVAPKVTFSDNELKYIRKARRNFLQKKGTHGPKASLADTLEKMAKFLNTKFHNGKEVHTAQEIDEYFCERKKNGIIKNYKRAFLKKEKAMPEEPFTEEEIKYVMKSRKGFRRKKRQGRKTSSTKNYANMATHLNKNFRKGKSVHTAKSVQKWYETRKQAYVDLIQNISEQTPSNQSAAKTNQEKSRKSPPEATKKQEVATNQQWMKKVMKTHPKDERLQFEKRFIYAAWKLYTPGKINTLSNTAVQSLTHILSVLRRQSDCIDNPGFKNCKIYAFGRIDVKTLRRMINKMLTCCSDLPISVPQLSKKEVAENLSWIKDVKEHHLLSQKRLMIEKKLIHALSSFHKKAKFDKLNPVQKWALTRITSGLRDNSKLAHYPNKNSLYSFVALDINAIEKIFIEIFEVIDGDQSAASEVEVDTKPKTPKGDQGQEKIVDTLAQNTAIGTIDQALNEQERIIVECNEKLNALDSNEQARSIKAQLEKLKVKAPSTSDTKALAQWAENLNRLVTELQEAESNAEPEAKPMSAKQLRAKTIKLLERKKAAQDLRQKITSTLNRLVEKVKN